MFTQERMALRSSLGRSLAAVGSPGPNKGILESAIWIHFVLPKKCKKHVGLPRTSPSDIPHKKLWFRDLKRLGCP